MSRKQSEELKALQSQLSQQEGILVGYNNEKKVLSSNINTTNQRIANIKNEINRLENFNKEIIVSEHAMLRYIERVIGINLEELSENILDEEDKEVIKSLGKNCTYLKDGFKVVVKNNVVTTVIDE